MNKRMEEIATQFKSAQKNILIRWLAWSCIFLLFVGDVRIPIGESTLFTPMAIFPALVLLFLRLIASDVYFLPGTLALIGVLIAGVLSAMWSDDVVTTRAVAAMFPIAAAIVVLLALTGVSGLHRIIQSAIMVGGGLLAILAFLLTVRAIFSGLDFYYAKLLIETPLGRSNYLGAFLLVFLAFVWGRSSILMVLALCALGALSVYSRGTALVFSLFLFVILIRKLTAGRKNFLLVVPVIGGFSIILAAIFSIAGFNFDPIDYFDHNSLESTGNRLTLWKASIEMLMQSPVFGVGPNGFRSLVEVYGFEDVWGPHNSILLLWLNYGILGLFCYLAYCFFIIQSMHTNEYFKKYDRQILILLYLLLFFSLFEPLVGSASFEILLGVLYLYSVRTRLEQRRDI
jgi:hypothetical protein